MNRANFFNVIRKDLYRGKLEQKVVNAFTTVLDELDCFDLPIAYKAYMLATAYHETAYTMLPVKEAYWLSEGWRKNNLRYYPYYGRGFVQLTWKENYERADRKLGLNGALTKNLDLALGPSIAMKVMVYGMLEGWFTNKKLSDYFDNGKKDYVGARKIINGVDKKQEIAAHARVFERALS